MANILDLQASVVQSLSDSELDLAIVRIVKSSAWSLDRASLKLSVRGPGCDHHEVDKQLSAVLERFDNGCAARAPLFYATTCAHFDLCLEDFWTGMFVAREIATWAQGEPVILIHLDDHTDMMPTLLEHQGPNLKDPLMDRSFDPALPDDWLGAIGSGSITIGSYMTALYHLKRPVHVRHLNNFASSRHHRFSVFPRRVGFPLLGERSFAAIGKAVRDGPGALGSYVGGPDADKVLADLPLGRLIVHVDLDYFINDFNGNMGEGEGPDMAQKREQASLRLKHFFEALGSSGRSVERWIVATSPGFCAARHWEWLLDRLTAAIDNSSTKCAE